MALASVGTLGTANATTANGSSLVLNPTATLNAGNIGIVIYAADSDDNSDGNSSSVSSVTDSGGNTWTKLREYNNNGDSSVSQRVVSVWFTKAVSDVTLTTGNITVNLAASVHDARAATAWEFTIGAGNSVQVVTNAADSPGDSADLPSMAISSLSSKEYLFLRGVGKNLRGGVFTATASYTAFTVATANTGGGSSSTEACGEFRILTGTSDTSDPTTSDTPTSANVFLALEEYTVPGIAWIKA